MARRRESDAIVIPTGEMLPTQPRQLISLGDHVEQLEETAADTRKRSLKHKKAKKAKKSRREDRPRPRELSDDEEMAPKRSQTFHTLSDSENSAEFHGYGPGYAPVFTRQPKRQSQLPEWLSRNSPPGPWDNDHSSQIQPITSSDSEPELMEPDFQAPPMPREPQGMRKKDFSLDEFMQAIVSDEDVGPNVWPDVAALVEGCWGKPHKDDIKNIYDGHKRPGNTPSLQKVVLDPELDAVLGERYPKSKRTDASLQAIGAAVSKAAICITEILHTNMSDISQEQATKDTMAKCFDAMRILAHGHAKVQHSRRELIKWSLDPAISKSLNRNASIENSNASHKLFGGDVHKQAKDGKPSDIDSQITSFDSCQKIANSFCQLPNLSLVSFQPKKT